MAAEVYAKASDITIKRGQHTTVAAEDSVVTGLKSVDSIIVCLDSDPIAAIAFVSAEIAAGSGTVTIKGWTSAFAAATTFSKLVNWIAVGPGA